MHVFSLWLLWVGCATPPPEVPTSSASPASATPSDRAPAPPDTPVPGATEPTPAAPSDGATEPAEHVTESESPHPAASLFEGLQPSLGRGGGGSGEHQLPSLSVEDIRRDPRELQVTTIEDAPIARRVVQHHRIELKHCLGEGKGRATWLLVIDAEGTATSATEQQNTFPHANAACIERALRKGIFPPPAEGRVRVVLSRGA